MISSILLLPNEKHHEALLENGPCGARVPTMHEVGKWAQMRFIPGRDVDRETTALVLAHEGRVIREACLRAMVVGDLTGYERLVLPYACPTIEDAERFARACASWGFGTVVRLDAEGREVTP